MKNTKNTPRSHRTVSVSYVEHNNKKWTSSILQPHFFNSLFGPSVVSVTPMISYGTVGTIGYVFSCSSRKKMAWSKNVWERGSSFVFYETKKEKTAKNIVFSSSSHSTTLY